MKNTNRCLFCKSFISADRPCCKNCNYLLALRPHKKKLQNNCICMSLFRYEGEYRNAVLRYKSGRKFKFMTKSYAMILNRTISDYYSGIDFDFYTAVPCSDKLFCYDRITDLAKETARLGKSEFKQCLCQTKKKKIQHSLNCGERSSNVDNIFKCIDGIDIKGKTILLFDDVITTGSTLTACSDELLRNGAKKVYCVTINW